MAKHMNKAWSLFEIKSFDEDERTFEGIASTPVTDRSGDIVEPKGARFKLPLAMLWQHGKGSIKDPVGWIVNAKVTDDDIRVKGQFAKPKDDYPQSLKDELNGAWVKVRDKLVRGLSIGFRPIESKPIKDSFAERFTAWEWLELSPVSIAANQDANIISVKSADMETLAASGDKRRSVVRLDKPPGATGITLPLKGNPMTIKEQISQFEAKVKADDARVEALISKAAEEARTFEDDEQKEHDSLKSEITRITTHIALLKEREVELVKRATPITPENTNTPAVAAAARGASVQVLGKDLPKGTLFTRYVGAMATCNGNMFEAAEYAKHLWGNSTPEVEEIIRQSRFMKSAVEAGDTTTSGWASQLIPAAQTMQNEFLDLLRPATIMGRIPGLRMVPPNTSVPVQTGGGTYQWVGEARRKPVTSMLFDSVTLRWAKAAGIVVITQELAKFSSPSAEAVVRNQMIKGCAAFLDVQFVDPAVAAVANVSPASITNGAGTAAASGTTAAAFRSDFRTRIAAMVANNQDPSQIVVLMSATVALNLSLLQNALGQAEYPGISVSGGTILGLPVVVSQAVGAQIILLIPDQVLVAPDGGITVDVSREATIEMDTEPLQGETSPLTTSGYQSNMFQDNKIALRVERWITWVRGRTSAVEYITNAVYSG